jgi:hypothetical protein
MAILEGRWFRALAALALAGPSVAFAVDDDALVQDAVECLRTLDGFNEDRQWAQYRISDGEVRALVQSGGEDWVFVELVCSGGNLAEGPRWKLPTRVTGSGTRPPVPMLARGPFEAATLLAKIERAREHADVGDAPLREFSVSYVHEPRKRTVYVAEFRDHGKPVRIEFDDAGVIDASAALEPDELVDAGEPQQEGANLGIAKLTQDPVKVAGYLAGAIGGSTKINRFIIDPSMMTVEWVSRDNGKILLHQWVTDEGRIFAPNDATPPNMDKVCAKPPTIEQVKASLAALMAQAPRAKRIRQSAMLILECEKPGTAMRWQLLGGDGVLKAGVALSMEDFPL